MTEEKKVYIVPEMKTVELNHRESLLLNYSNEGAFIPPHEQNPIA